MAEQKILNFSNAKTIKGEKRNYKTGIVYLAPANIASPNANLCPFSTAGCRAACLYTAGRGAMNNTQKARIKKTKAYLANKDAFISRLACEVSSMARSGKKRGFNVAVRFNGTSDLPIETWGVMEKAPDVQWYDYTKNPNRMAKFLAGEMPKNYHLTFSLSENNHEQARRFLAQGGNVAIVFRTRKVEEFPATYWGFPVISGDEDDLRFLDPKGVFVALKMKGKAPKDSEGFVFPVKEA